MKSKLFAAALAALTLASVGAASAQDYRRGDLGGQPRYDQRGDFRRNSQITIRKDGRTFAFDRGDRMFYRLLDRPFHFRPGMTYSYTDRCNRNGCVAFVFDGRHRAPVDRIFAPHLRDARYAYRDNRSFDRNYGQFGDYDRDDRGWNNDDDRAYRDNRGRDGQWDDRRGDNNGWNDDDRDGRDDRLEGAPRPRSR